ncbi:endoplasmic reticulum junction formation protein lunapark-like [Babylonia areolata]|uniref:endoplasmic reticulum junction formation protein lunapark-like n=1 Tax=Babylonia areolata TaxID=304850 RepID=UPI003FD50DB7
MGLITSRFRESKSTIEILETIDKDLKSLQRNRRQNQEQQKRVAASLLLYSVILYILAAVLFYFFYWPDTWQRQALYSLPLIVFPFIVWLTRKLLHWYFVKRLTANDLAVNELREKKKLILEDVMEKETYKKAREILEKFDPARFKKLEKSEGPQVASGTPGTVVRQRVMPVSPTVMTPQGPRPAGPTPGPTPQWSARPTPSATPAGRGRGLPPAPVMTPMRYSPPPGPPMPRTVLPKDRGTMEKLIDFVVGDGPQNRFALICRFCQSHNGMALPEEFEYLSFRCCYCYNMNQARKMRPFAPRLEFPEVPPQAAKSPAAASGTTSGSKVSAAEDRDGEDASWQRQ